MIIAMQTKIEGILISKAPYQDRHLIGHLLLRTGKKISVIFYGGQGGGKKKKGSTLELGYMMSLEMGRSRSHSDLYNAKEWRPLWYHQKIRENHLAYYLLCFILEVTEKLASRDDLHDEHRDFNTHDGGLFRAVSNAIFNLEKAVREGAFHQFGELFIFLGKVLLEQGFFPMRESCLFCDRDLSCENSLYLIYEHGGFSCCHCLNQDDLRSLSEKGTGRQIWELLGVIANHKYSEITGIMVDSSHIVGDLLNYFCFQVQINRKDFKSLPMLL